jgi:hypothetical protein
MGSSFGMRTAIFVMFIYLTKDSEIDSRPQHDLQGLRKHLLKNNNLGIAATCPMFLPAGLESCPLGLLVSDSKINKINLIFFCIIDRLYLIDIFTDYRVYLIA